MNEHVKKLSEEIRKLSPEEQAELVDEQPALTYSKPDPEIERARAEEAEQRLDAFERGECAAAPLEDAMARLRSRYPRKR